MLAVELSAYHTCTCNHYGTFSGYLYVFSRVSAHLRVSAHPPFFDDQMFHVYMRYTYKWLVCVSAHLRFFGQLISSAHGRLLERIRYVRTQM